MAQEWYRYTYRGTKRLLNQATICKIFPILFNRWALVFLTPSASKYYLFTPRSSPRLFARYRYSLAPSARLKILPGLRYLGLVMYEIRYSPMVPAS